MARIYKGPVYLEPIEHVYIHRETGKKYKSVTTALGKVEPHFDTEGVAGAIVNQADDVKQEKYIGMNKIQILDHWQEINDTANEYGNKVHELLERYLLANKYYPTTDEFEKRVIREYEKLGVDEGMMIWPERIMFSAEHLLAGTADLKIDIDDEWFDIGDWKTNKEYNFFNKYGFKTLLKPFEHLQDCQHSIYSLQLSTYALMCEMETGMKCRHIWIGYWDKITETFSKIPVTYLKHEARQLLDHHKYMTEMEAA